MRSTRSQPLEKLTQKTATQTEIQADSFDNPFDLKADEKLVTVN
jgi:hypothetical protein